jgi:hypothetical protein
MAYGVILVWQRVVPFVVEDTSLLIIANWRFVINGKFALLHV